MPFIVNDLVDVRSNKALPWRPGTVTEVNVGVSNGCYRVALDTPVTANDWSGVTRRYAGTELLSEVFVFKHAEKLAAGDHIRVQGG